MTKRQIRLLGVGADIILIVLYSLIMSNLYPDSQAPTISILPMIFFVVVVPIAIYKFGVLDKYATIEETPKDLEKQQQRKESRQSFVDGLSIVTAQLIYYGGGLINKEKKVNVSVSKKGVKYGSHFIPLDAIKGVNIETQSQITSRLTLTRMATFGLASVAFPKSKSNVTKFLTIDYDEGMPSTLVFGGKNINKISSSILKVKRDESR